MRFRLRGSACSKINSKGKGKTNFLSINDNGYLDWMFHKNVFPLRESNSILSPKGKGFTFEELFKNPFTEFAFEFDYKKESVLKILIQIHQTLKTS